MKHLKKQIIAILSFGFLAMHNNTFTAELQWERDVTGYIRKHERFEEALRKPTTSDRVLERFFDDITTFRGRPTCLLELAMRRSNHKIATRMIRKEIRNGELPIDILSDIKTYRHKDKETTEKCVALLKNKITEREAAKRAEAEERLRIAEAERIAEEKRIARMKRSQHIMEIQRLFAAGLIKYRDDGTLSPALQRYTAAEILAAEKIPRKRKR